MSHTRIAQVAFVAVLGSALAAHAGAQQDSSGASANGAGNPAQPAPSAVVALPAPMAAPVTPPLTPKTQQSPQDDSSRRGHPRALRPRGSDAAVEGPRLGVMVKQTPDGLQVTEVADGTLAGNIGIKPQDVILRIDDEHIESIADVQRTLSTHVAGETVNVAVIRAGEGIVTLSGTLPEPVAQPESKQAPQAGPIDPAEPEEPLPSQADGFRGGFLGVQLAQAAGDDANPGATPGDKSGGNAPSSGPGVEVAGIVPESAAWFAGLEPGDRILTIDGKELASTQDLVGAVSGKEPGTLVDVKFTHAGEERTSRVRLGERHPTSDVGALFPGLNFVPFGQGQGGQGGPGGGQGGGLGLNVQRPRGRGPFGGLGGGAGLGPRGGMQGFPFDDDSFGDMLPGNIQQFLKGLDLDAQGSQRQSVRVEMRNGKGTLTVTRDGKTETYTMDDQGQWKKSAGPDPSAPDASPQGAAPSGTQ